MGLLRSYWNIERISPEWCEKKGEFKGKETDQHLGNWSCLQSCQELEDKMKPALMSVPLSSSSRQVVIENVALEPWGHSSEHATIQHTFSIVFMSWKMK